MKRSLAYLALAIIAISTSSVPILPALAAQPSSGIQFVPQVILSPDDNATPMAPYSPSNACNSPPPLHTSVYFHCYTPSDIYAAYGVDKLHAAGLTGKGETIVIIDAYGSPTIQNDLNFFSGIFGLPKITLTIVYPTGTPTFNGAPLRGAQLGWAVETSLDVEWSHAIAPDANIVLIATNPAETEGVQGFPTMFIGEQYAVNHYPGAVISQSFAATEQSFHSAGNPIVAEFDKVYQQAITNHITIFGSAGDSGTTNVIGGQGVSPGKVVPFPTVNWPSSDPFVTSAGGAWLQYGWTWNPSSPTDLTFITTPGSRTEAVWNEPFLPAATGGGLSVLFPTPSFQSGISPTLLNGHRGLPDLSWNSAVDGGVLVYTSFLGVNVGWHIVGGTSASSPQLAGLIAITNQLADSKGKQHVGYLNPYLYSLPATDFNDIVPQTFGPGAVTIDNNQLYGSPVLGYQTTVGWDLTTGFGSPNAYNFVTDLAAALP